METVRTNPKPRKKKKKKPPVIYGKTVAEENDRKRFKLQTVLFWMLAAFCATVFGITFVDIELAEKIIKIVEIMFRIPI